MFRHLMHAGFAAVLMTAVLMTAVLATAAWAGPTYDDPAKVDEDFAIQGEYAGDMASDGKAEKVGVQVVALGKGKFDAVVYTGGLPGAGWDRSKPKHTLSGGRAGDAVQLAGEKLKATIRGGTLTLADDSGAKLAACKKVMRSSPTLGAKPPKGAIVLFDGTTADHFQNGRLTPDGLLMQGVTSKQTFQAHRVHLEFRTPYQPEDRGQARGNSGCYLQGRYEVQVLDSFGLEGKDNECGGIYSCKAPDVNMCLPPLSWQTYDIDFTPARFDADGKKVANARMTVRHNGVVVHQDVEVPDATRASPLKEGPQAGPLYLQDHGNPVRYRNIWVVELPAK